jgi:hypothetical protein
MCQIDYDCFTSIYRNGLKRGVVMRKWRRFLFSLLHPHLTELHVPSSFFSEKKQICECLKLLKNIGARCSGLRLLEAKNKLLFGPPDIRLQKSFFRVLPQLVNLQVVRIKFFFSGDWALQQFAHHGTNLV